jgi:hypothetical protein
VVLDDSCDISCAAWSHAFLSGGGKPLRVAPASQHASPDASVRKPYEVTVNELQDPEIQKKVQQSPEEKHPDFNLHYIEFNDEGSLWNPALSDTETVSPRTQKCDNYCMDNLILPAETIRKATVVVIGRLHSKPSRGPMVLVPAIDNPSQT